MKSLLILGISLVGIFLTTVIEVNGQFYYPNLTNNIWAICDTFYVNYDPAADSLEGGVIREFKRWEDFYLPRLAPSGEFDVSTLFDWAIVDVRYSTFDI
jgi:hypothetical protein